MPCELMCSLNPSLTQIFLTKFAGEPPWQFPRGWCYVDLYNLNSIECILIDFAVHVNFTHSESNKFRRTLQEIDIKRGHVYFQPSARVNFIPADIAGNWYVHFQPWVRAKCIPPNITGNRYETRSCVFSICSLNWLYSNSFWALGILWNMVEELRTTGCCM